MTTQQVTESSKKPMRLCKDKTQHYISLFLLYSIPLFAFIAFSSLSAYWVQAPYDGWRIYELIILMAFGAYLICTKKTNASFFSAKTNKVMAIILIVMASLVACSSYYAQYSQRAIADAALYFLLASGIYAQAVLFRKNPSVAPKIAAWLAILPMLTLIFLPITIYDRLHGFESDWYQSFSNYRMLDDALLPCIFLLWLRPAWLSSNQQKNKKCAFFIYLVSTIYLLSFWLNGARAALIAIAISLLIVIVLKPSEWRSFKLPITTLVVSGLSFYIFSQILATSIGSTLIRTDSSERLEIAKKSLNLWLQHPVLGVGGDHFLISNPYMKQGHPHNIPLQWIAEWGIAGFLTLFLLIPFIYLVFKHKNNLNKFLIAACLAVIINSLLSGSMIYPVSQIIGTWCLAWLIALLPLHKPTLISSSVIGQLIIPKPQTLFKLFSIAAIFSILYVHGMDILCMQCESIDNVNAPRFWGAGRALHLTPKVIN